MTENLEQMKLDYLKALCTQSEIVLRGTKYERHEYDIEQWLFDWRTEILDDDAIRLAYLDGGIPAVVEYLKQSITDYLNEISETAVYEEMGLRK